MDLLPQLFGVTRTAQARDLCVSMGIAMEEIDYSVLVRWFVGLWPVGRLWLWPVGRPGGVSDSGSYVNLGPR